MNDSFTWRWHFKCWNFLYGQNEHRKWAMGNSRRWIKGPNILHFHHLSAIRCQGYADRDERAAQAFTAAWGPGAAAGPRVAGRGWRLLPLHRCGGGRRGSGSCGGRYSRRRSSTASWPQSCCCEPCCRNPCMSRTSSPCLEVIGDGESDAEELSRNGRPGKRCSINSFTHSETQRPRPSTAPSSS